MKKKQRKHSTELEDLLAKFPAWLKYAQIVILIFVAAIFAFLFYFV